MGEEKILFKYYDVPDVKPDNLTTDEYAELQYCAQYEINKMNKNCWNRPVGLSQNYKNNDSGACQTIGLNTNLDIFNDNGNLHEKILNLDFMKKNNTFDDSLIDVDKINSGPTKFAKYIKYILYNEENNKIKESDTAPLTPVVAFDVAQDDVARDDEISDDDIENSYNNIIRPAATTGGKPKSRRSNKKKSNKKKTNKKRTTTKRKSNKKKRKTHRRR
jgi:hypothetical protein